MSRDHPVQEGQPIRRQRRISFRRALGACVVAFATIPAAGAAATPIAILTDAGIGTLDDSGHTVTPLVAGAGWQGLAYSADGMLFATRDAGSESGCELVEIPSGTVVARSDDVLAATERDMGLCEIATDPRDGLLFGASNGTAGSLSSWRLDLATLGVTEAIPGYEASAALDGTVVAVEHRYWKGGGSYEQPWIAFPGGRARALAKAPPRLGRLGRQFTATAISRDAAVVAGTAIAGAGHGALYLTSPTRRFGSPAWTLTGKRQFAGVQWLPDRSGLIVGVLSSYSSRSFALYRTDARGGHRTRLLDRVQAFAVAPR
jgi:hypothetical protein